MPVNTLLKLILLVILLTGMTVGITISLYIGWTFLAFTLIVFAIGCLAMIITTYSSSARKVAFMFDAIENDDFTFRFTGNSRRLQSDYVLNRSLNRIKDLVLRAREDAREREKYYEIILSKVNTGVMVFNSQGVVFRVNNQSLRLLGVSQLTHIRQLDVISDGLVNVFMSIEAGQSQMIQFYDEVTQVSLNLTATSVVLQGANLKIVAMTDIAHDVDNVKMESWQRMSRVLTHEIMNSLAPITSLSETLLTTTDYDTTRRGLEIIHDTSSGLTRFVENYRTITRIPPPKLVDTDLGTLLEREIALMCPKVKLTIASSDCIVAIDKGQISQVVVNLLKNAKEAANEDQIWVDVGRNSKGRLYVDVCNRGAEIPNEVRDNIFVPFFTTKDSGNGIGLSLSRQIMRLHDGTISLVTKPFTKFRMQF